MRIQGKLTRSGSWWAVEIPLLLLFTQGKTKKEAYEMAKDAVESLINEAELGIEVIPSDENGFFIEMSESKQVLSAALKQNRMASGKTIREIVKILGQSSPTAYKRYELGKVEMSLQKFYELMSAIRTDMKPVITMMKCS